jgi:hypothetical protein
MERVPGEAATELFAFSADLLGTVPREAVPREVVG